MLALLSEIRFWSTQEELSIKDTDYGAYKYYERKENTLSAGSRSKKEYAERRDYLWNLTNKRPAKLKDKLKELEDQMLQNRVVYCKWADTDVLQIMLCTGVLVNICVNTHTADIRKISFDKYLVGKLQSEYISDVLITRTNLLCTYNDNQITVLHFTKPSVSHSVAEKLHRLEPRLLVAELAGPAGRKLERKMSTNVGGDKLLVWWRCTRDEVYPWSPLVKDQDRANIHVYTLSGLKLELLCYRRTEFDPVGVTFSTTDSNIVHCVEQKVSRKGAVTVETCTYEIVKNKLQQLLITSIPLQTQVCCHAFSPDNEKLLLGCIDGSVVLFDQGRGVTHLVKAAFIPTIASWHRDGAVLLVANERCQIQCFDVSLANVKCQTVHEDAAPSTVLDLTAYFKAQPTLVQMVWNRKPQLVFQCERYLHTDALLLLLFEHGPLTVVRLVGSAGARGDLHTPGLTADVLVCGYIWQNQIDRAIGIVLSLNWDMYGPSCLMALHRIIGHLIKQRLTPETEGQIQRALGSYYAPLQPISEAVHAEFGEQVKDLTRKFFHLLVRYRMFEKAFCLAIDVNDYDLFMDLYYCAHVVHNEEMAVAALNRAKDLISRSNSSNDDHSVCSHSSCSQCSDSDGNDSWTNVCAEDVTSFSSTVPPLPVPMEQPTVPLAPPPLPMLLHITSTTSTSTTTTTTTNRLLLQLPTTVRKLHTDPALTSTGRRTYGSNMLAVKQSVTDTHTNTPLLRLRGSTEFGSSLSLRPSGELASAHPVRAASEFGSTLSVKPVSELSTTRSGSDFGSSHLAARPSSLNVDTVGILKPRLTTNLVSVSVPSAFKSVVDSGVVSSHSNSNSPVRSYTSTTKLYGGSSSSGSGIYPSMFSNSALSVVPAREMIVHRTVSMNIPPAGAVLTVTDSTPLKLSVPLQCGTSSNNNTSSSSSAGGNSNSGTARTTGEKNVKFSETVTAFIVPEITRSDKATPVKERPRRPSNRYLTDPKQELADSLPLCHPNDDYLKDFTPITNNSEDDDAGTKIKVVHFGMV